jgi:hypothetical protein
MHRKVLQCRVDSSAVFVISLKPLDISRSGESGQIRVFAVGLMPSSPPRVAEDIDVRRPEGKPLIDAGSAESAVAVVFGSRFFRNRFADAENGRGSNVAAIPIA